MSLPETTVRRRLATALLGAMFFGGTGYVAARYMNSATHAVVPRISPGRVQSGTEVIAVFLVSTTCGASRFPTLASSLARVRERLAARAVAAHRKFYTIGVSLDEQPAVGLAFLASFGEFDEVMAGGSWAGMGAVDFMLRGLPGPLSMPQLILLERDLKVESAGITASSDRVIMRKVGATEIIQLSSAADGVFQRLF